MQGAKQSPRSCDDGTIRWYCGDTFAITFKFILRDDSGMAIKPEPTDKIEIFFKDLKDEVVASFSAIGTDEVIVNIDVSLTQKFPEGVYNIVAKYNSEFVTTLLHNSKVVVE